jgi:Fur family peroxide stress response transcriptional regulator
MRDALDAEGVAITPRRDKLLEILVASERHPSVSEIHQEVQRFFPGTSLATVYNTIELLKEIGQILEIEFSGTPNRYDGRKPHAHPHLVCLKCGRIDDIDVAYIHFPSEAVAEATGYEVTGHRTEYYGMCPQCRGATDDH